MSCSNVDFESERVLFISLQEQGRLTDTFNDSLILKFSVDFNVCQGDSEMAYSAQFREDIDLYHSAATLNLSH